MRLPSSKPPPTVVAATGCSGSAAHHIRRCSSDRKNLSAVQRDRQSRRSAGLRAATVTITPAASGPGRSGPTGKSIGSRQ